MYIQPTFDYVTYNNQIYKSNNTPNQDLSCYEITDNKLYLKQCNRELQETINDPFGGYTVIESNTKTFIDYTGDIEIYKKQELIDEYLYVNFSFIYGIVQKINFIYSGKKR